MKKNYVAPTIESYMLDQSDVITTSGAPVSKIGNGEYGVNGSALFD